MTTQSKYVPRQRRGNPGRHLPAELSDGMKRRREEGIAASKEPLVGITENGVPEKGLFKLDSSGPPLDDIRTAVETYLSGLTPGQRKAGTFPLDAPEWRQWLNIHAYVLRHGVLIEDLDDAGRERALNILRATLSPQGFETARNVMRLNHTIGEITGSEMEYGEWLYWMSVMGQPGPNEPWGWQIDGHHLIVNCLLLNGQLVTTPMFMGSEPVTADAGKYAGTTVFREEESQAYALMTSLTAEQQRKATIGEELPLEVFTTAFRDNFEMRYEGVRYDELSSHEQSMLLSLIETYVGRARSDHAAIKMAEVKQHLNRTHFAWIGSVGDDEPFYYRVHSPVILIEFDHQRGVALDNDQASRSHIHTIVRTPNGNDYGADLLRQHHEHSDHAHP